MMGSIFFFAAALLVHNAPSNSNSYIISEVSSSVASDAILGAIGSGLICVPVGKLRWTDLAKAAPSAWVASGQQALSEARSEVDISGAAPPPSHYRVKLTIKELKLNLCRPWMGIGKKPRGKGTMTVEFVARDTTRNIDLPPRTMLVDIDLRGRDPRKDDSVLTQAIAEAARAFLTTQPPG